uniref:Uncharacterized protein n=1 Tax=Myoviridae sp. ctMb725 TaxID=2825088 RepID=A0A8S5PU25_9CAUD|nr:MAG TPA: hypothetical protein [Myoviridae sp. ctMb725]DAV34158.1 MAG TPA: hypothetical protein [Caudoviricetes sp.]
MEQIKKSICSGLRPDGKALFSSWNRWNTFLYRVLLNREN